ncbi:conserved hypothetical protein [Talaromyces stipitatus ATCC 10500]|uniref:non-specific serine/threonine protein kinase n=1 Tax=Talaromyces stipitatus (strain ATCC 10500 / CBS 375.48 / QM 6759 / NRRL 1006) TaxID=441959 RepID=B8M3X4_TALSN|nr:uncharacterized protein TSTA_039190 [Talaromyces stipitatus ATCC 10500]EED20717.1 conserved hypothetical protein [Talaromyces stipitatus ATCC 10500]
MASETFDNLCNQVYWQLYNRLERKDDPNLRFATNGTAEKVLHNDLLIRLFQSLLVANNTAVQQFGLAEEELAERVDDRELHDFLAVLLFASCGIEAARRFTKKLVARNDWPLKGRFTGQDTHRLPASREDLLHLFKDSVIVDKFCSSQACFSTVVIHNRQEVVVESLSSQRLPYLEEEELGSGSFGKVFKVKIAKGHFKDTRHGTLNATSMDVARKDYITTTQFDGQDERNMMERILTGSTRKCENILGNFGSLRIGTNSYSLFMPCAICDLSDYMTKYHPTRPSSVHEKAKIVLSAKGLAEGLDFLHNEMKGPDQQDMVCYHMDLKPSNILIFRDTAYDGGIRYVWKLSDFGMARVKYRSRGQTVEREEMDFNSAFLQRIKPEAERSPSGTRNRRGEGTYLPPESLTSTRTMTTASDVWSLGCVLSVVFAYLEDGGEGVENYQLRRLRHADSDGYDRFFVRGRRFTPNKDHPEVHKTHTWLINKAAQRQAEEMHAVHFMLRYLENRVLVLDYRKRDGVKTVKEKLAQTYTYFKSMPPVENHLTGEHHTWIDRTRSRGTPLSHWQVDSWQLSSTEGLKGCEISPRGDLVAYWSDNQIRLYNELSLPPQVTFGEPPVVSPAAEYTLGLTDCIWKSVAVTDRFLIASTTGAVFQCYVYDLVFIRQYRITLQLPEISRLAISPDSRIMACVMQSKEEGQECGSVFIVPIEELIQEAPRQMTPSTQGSSGTESEGSLSRRGLPHDSTTLKLDWSASDITYISFPTPDEVYLIVQPQITARSRENEIPIIHLSLKTRPRLLQTVLVRSQGVDPGNTVGLFTAFTAFRQQQSTCAFIAREKQLYIQNLAYPGTTAIENSIKNYRVLKLVMDWNDRKIFALGTPSGTNRVYLLEMTVPQSEVDRVTVTELVSLPDLSQDDEFTQVLSSNSFQQGGDYILIAALTNASRRWIYRISLPDSSAAT